MALRSCHSRFLSSARSHAVPNPHLVVAHHASGKLEDLRKKWLNDPANVKKGGPKPTAPPVDIIKTIRIANDERKRTPNPVVTLALTTNQEPTEDVIRDVQALANHMTSSSILGLVRPCALLRQVERIFR